MLRKALVLTIASLILPAVAGAQSLSDLAREKDKEEKKKSSTPTYTATDLRRATPRSTGVDSVPANANKPAAEGASDTEEGEGGEGSAEGSDEKKTPAQERAEAQTAWQAKLTEAEAAVTKLQGEISQLEAGLAATTGMYTAEREGKSQRLEKARAELAAAQRNVASLRNEGRRNGYR